MKFNYKFRRLCGAYYGYPVPDGSWNGSNILFDGDRLISAVGNRIQIIDLQTVTVRTLPVESRSNIRCLAYSHPLLFAVDVQNYAMLIHIHRGVVLHRMKFHSPVRCLEFSPSARLLAVGTGQHVEVWYTPTATQELQVFCPLQKHRTYTGLTDDVTCITFSPDESVLMAGSRDCSVRIWTVSTVKNYVPVTLQGHKSPIVGIYLGEILNQHRFHTLHTISMDGSLVTWECTYEKEDVEVEAMDIDSGDEDEVETDAAMEFFTGRGDAPTSTAHELVRGTWKVQKRHYFQQEKSAPVTSTSYSLKSKLLSVGFASGIFGLYEMPDLTNLHTLSVGNNQLVQACQLNHSGEWLALACPKSQQLLVWEWRSETYVLKQRGHAYGMRCMAYSPDSVCIATGGEDGKLKLWNAVTGFCYVTFAEKTHTAPVTAVTFANSSVVVSASLDGTVKAHDLHRYRTFKTLTTPTPVQFLSLAVDSAGEIVVAGSTDPFQIYSWNLQTGKLLDIFAGHSGPVCGLAFRQGTGVLASASWDGTVKIWDLYKGTNAPVESFQHSTDVVCVAVRPDGAHLCSGTIGGLLSFWNIEDGKLLFEIDGRRDIAGGRKINDRMTANNNASSRYFSSISYSADGSYIIAGGNSKYVCIYEVSQQILIKKFQISHNRSLDGVLDELNSKNLGEGGPIDEEEGSGDETTNNAMRLPGAKRGDDGSRKSRVEVLTMQVSFSPTGREWSIVSGEGLHIYSLDDDMIFDPISLTEAITPAAVEASLLSKEYGMALRMAIHLNEFALVKNVLEQTPYKSIPHVVRSIGPEQLECLLQFVAKIIADSPHIEFYLEWSLQLLQTHAVHLERHRGRFMQAFRSLFKVISTRHDELKSICNENKYTLRFIQDHANLLLEHGDPSKKLANSSS